MDTISLNGEKFLKASSIAKELGYTADYVGQLARAGKVKATLVGRTWYVEEQSIKAHKNTRYRSTVTKSRNELQKTLHDQHNTLTSKPTYSYLKSVVPQQITYHEDEHDLIPVVSSEKTHTVHKQIGVELADAEQVHVKKTESPYKISVSERPTVSFGGTLVIKSADDHFLHVQSSTKSHTVPVEKHRPKKRASNGVHIKVRDNDIMELVPLHYPASVQVVSLRVSIPVAILVGITLVLFFQIFEVRHQVTNSTYTSTYTLNAASLASIYWPKL